MLATSIEVHPASAARSVSFGPGSTPSPSGGSASMLIGRPAEVVASTRLLAGSTLATMLIGMRSAYLSEVTDDAGDPAGGARLAWAPASPRRGILDARHRGARNRARAARHRGHDRYGSDGERRRDRRRHRRGLGAPADWTQPTTIRGGAARADAPHRVRR